MSLKRRQIKGGQTCRKEGVELREWEVLKVKGEYFMQKVVNCAESYRGQEIGTKATPWL